MCFAQSDPIARVKIFFGHFERHIVVAIHRRTDTICLRRRLLPGGAKVTTVFTSPSIY